MTNKTLYETYVAEVENGKPVSPTFFFYQILGKMNIHHSKKVKFCPICEKLEEGDQSEAVLKHKELWPIQRAAYQQIKKKIATGETPTTFLITQDFTQLEFEGSFVQDLIVCKYSFDKDGKGRLARDYKHFVGQGGVKNDIYLICGWLLDGIASVQLVQWWYC